MIDGASNWTIYLAGYPIIGNSKTLGEAATTTGQGRAID